MLEQIFSERQLRRDDASLQTYGKDWTNGFTIAPSAVVFPQSMEQVEELVAFARAGKHKLVPSGGRTGLSGGAVASQGEIVVSFEKMNRILDFSAKAMLAYRECRHGLH